MSGVQVRPFRRADRDQVTQLVNSHAAAVVPGVSASVNAVLAQFEREPDELIVDPWVAERRALVAERAGGIRAAALVLHYRHDADVAPGYRGAGELRWLVFPPEAPPGNSYWQDGWSAAHALMHSCLDLFTRSHVTRQLADGALPVHGVYGVPAQWPHVAELYADHGFIAPPDAVELVHLAAVADLPPIAAARADVDVRRSVGINGVRLSAFVREERVGYLEIDVLDSGERHARHGLADIGNLDVTVGHRRRGVATALLAHAARWLALAHVDRLLSYAAPADQALISFLERRGFIEITRTRRGWERAAVPHGD